MDKASVLFRRWKVCVGRVFLIFGDSWNMYLPLAEFRIYIKYFTGGNAEPDLWGEVGQRVPGSTEMVQKTTENLQKIREQRLQTAPNRQKSYADRRRSDLEFQVAYRLELPEILGQIHNTFHMSQSRKCLVGGTMHIPLDDMHPDESLNYVERPVEVLKRKEKRLLKNTNREGSVAASKGFRVDLGARSRVVRGEPLLVDVLTWVASRQDLEVCDHKSTNKGEKA
ncbi:LOW QUALITY PROTEIN: hypothetical protein OSB04_003133 [Centaurea solstitialis]|uniref:Uncharacterized protein n=1 Tax=Centaurea solstitialis TaxID=347529 RepID=A0AA38WMY0_9ASTR|nr:LOW QUALITY PROTEIN: hypothetical protein OSB04_003133 [Centaurea solstitialis]